MPLRERDLDVDEEYDVDGGLDMYESRNSKATKETAAKRQRTSQIADLRRTNNALDNCNLCFGSTRLAKHLTIAMGQTAYLSIPDRCAKRATSLSREGLAQIGSWCARQMQEEGS